MSESAGVLLCPASVKMLQFLPISPSMYLTAFHFDHNFPNLVLSDGYCRFGTFLSHEVANCRSKSFFVELLKRGVFRYFHGRYPKSTTLLGFVSAMSICTHIQITRFHFLQKKQQQQKLLVFFSTYVIFSYQTFARLVGNIWRRRNTPLRSPLVFQ